MNSFVEISLKQFFKNRSELFGEGAIYLGFENDQKYSAKEGNFSTMIFGRIKYRKGNENRYSGSLILKQMPQKEKINSDTVTSQMTNEIFFYTHVLPFLSSYRKIDSIFPEFFDSLLEINSTKKEAILILENLQEIGFRMSDRKSFLDFDHLSLMLRKLGNFHAVSYKAKKENPTRFRTLCDLFANTYVGTVRKYSESFSKLGKYGLRGLKQNKQFRERILNIERRFDSLPQFVDQLYLADKYDLTAVLCHGDFLSTNVMFKYNGGKPVDLKIIDMANCALASPVVDLALVLYVNADQEMRDDHWDDLMDEYHAGLEEYFPDQNLPSRRDILAQFEDKSFIGYIVASYFLRHLINMDNNSESYHDRLPQKYKNVPHEDIPQDDLFTIVRDMGGSLNEKALSDILKDMLDRNFIQS